MKKVLKFAIRADGSKEIGMGHIVRMVAIADELRQYDAEIFFITKPYDSGVNFIKDRGFPIFLIDKDLEQDRNQAFAIKSILRKNNCTNILHDIKNTGYIYMHELKNEGVRTVNFDDNGSGSIFADLIFDPFIKKDKSSEKNKRFYGPDYLILRDEFGRLKINGISKRIKNICIMVGGTDASGILSKIVKWISEMPGSYNVYILAGINRNIGFNTLYSDHKHSFNVISDWDKVPQILSKCDLAVTSGGISMCEACAIGLPVVAIAQVPHENHNISMFSEENAVVDLGIARDLNPDIFKLTIKMLDKKVTLRKILSSRALSIVDGLGKKRVAEKIIEYTILHNKVIEYNYGKKNLLSAQRAAVV